MLGKVVLGFFVGLLCGLIPFFYGFLKKYRKIAILGISITALSGVLFSVLEKSPFSSVVVGVLFILMIIINERRNSLKNHDDEEDDDEYL